MSFSLFNKTLLITTLSLLITILALFYFTTNTPLKVLELNLNGTVNEASISNQHLTIRFNRPLPQFPNPSTIKISPYVPISSVTNADTLHLILERNLLSHTPYTITITKNFSDLHGTTLAEPFTTTFTTKPLSLFYQTETDIFKTDPRLSSSESLIHQDMIVDYAYQAPYLSTIVAIKGTNQLELYNLATKEQTKPMNSTQHIYDSVFSPKSLHLYVLAEHTAMVTRNNYSYPKRQSLLHRYNLAQDQMLSLNLDELLENTTKTMIGKELSISPDGTALLIKVQEIDSQVHSNYYLLNLSNPEKLELLGNFATTGGVHPNGDQLMFTHIDDATNKAQIVSLNSNNQLVTYTNPDTHSIDPHFFFRTPAISYAHTYSNLDPGKGLRLFEVRISSPTGRLIKRIHDDSFSLQNPLPSPDDQYLAVERYTASDLDAAQQRQATLARTPYTSEIIVYNLDSDTQSQPIPGYNPSWH